MKNLTKSGVAFVAALSFGALYPCSGLAQTSDLLISEYVEGSSSNKYIEIYNGTGSSVDLSDYELRLYSNGSASPSIANALSGTLADGTTIVYKNASATVYSGSATSLTSVNFNGNDAVELYNTLTSSSADIFGVIGCDPGTQWTSASNQTQNVTLRRKMHILAGIATNPSCTSSPGDFTSLESEWTEYAQNDISGLGTHIAMATDCPVELLFSEYIEGSGNNKCLEIINKTGASVDLAAGGYQIKIYFNGSTTAGTVISLTGTIANNDVFVVCDHDASGTFLAQADLTSVSNFFNGDDAVALVKNGMNIDIIGEIGNDPGASWSASGISTLNRTLVRNSNVIQGVSVNPSGFPTLATEWTGFSTDFVDSLGQHYVDCGDTTPAGDPDYIEIVNTQTNEVGFLVDGMDNSGDHNDVQFIAAPSASLKDVLAFEDAPTSGVGEIIAFTENSPVIVETNVNWTTNSDTIPVVLDTAKIRVPITIWIVYAPNNDFAAQEQKALQDMLTTQINFEKERLGVEFSQVTVIDATNDPDAPTYYDFTCGMRTGLETDIGNVAGQINIYYLRTVDGSTTRGQSCTIGSNFSALGANAGVELQSHEVGHNLYLFHVDALTSFGFSQTNIMHSASNTREFLTEGQTFRAHVAPESSINDTYNARPGQLTRTCSGVSTNILDYGCPAIQTRIWSDL